MLWLYNYVHGLWFSLIIRKPIFKSTPFRLTGSCTNSLKCTRSRWRRWGRSLSSSRNRRATPQPVGSATKQNLLMDAAITVPIAKPSSALAVEAECHYAQTRYMPEKWSFSNSSACCEWNGPDTWNYLDRSFSFLPNVRGNLNSRLRLCLSFTVKTLRD